MTQPAPHRFAIVLCPGFSHLALPMVTEPLFIANWLAGRQHFAWRTCSVDGLAVTTSAGQAVAVDAPLGPDDQAGSVLVLASFDTQRSVTDRRLTAWLRRMARNDALLVGIETGSEVLAAAGLLDGRRVAVHWYNVEAFCERFPRTVAEPRRMMIDGRVASSAGATATIDLMLALIDHHAGATISAEVARHLLVVTAPGATPFSPAPPPPADPLVARAMTLIDARLGTARDIGGLAAELGVSTRQLHRRFAAGPGTSPDAVWRERQFARAHQLVQQTDLALTEIAVAVGFGSLEAFSRAYRGRFGTAPSRDRAQTTGTSVFGPPDLPGRRPGQ